LTNRQAIRGEYVESILSVMGSCGMYDYAGEWLYRVGMPAKSGVAGGVIAVLPGQLGIGVFSPPLDSRGNSVRDWRFAMIFLGPLICTCSTHRTCEVCEPGFDFRERAAPETLPMCGRSWMTWAAR